MHALFIPISEVANMDIFWSIMTSSTSTIDYRNTLFQYPTLTKIHGEPTAEAILKSTKEIKANARSVYSDFGGGKHGHLFLVLIY